jgi:CO/xanthine dehydrogenase FAD-binding subunit
MIIEYQRPQNLKEALILLAREEPVSYPLGGGTFLNRGGSEQIAVIDLQALGLNTISINGTSINIGATTSLQALAGIDGLPGDFYKVIELEANYNLRQVATIAGRMVTADGRSPLATALLALSATIEIQTVEKKPEKVNFGDWLPLRNGSRPGRLITLVCIPANVYLGYEYIARTPADLPIVCAAVAKWDSGRTRLALGGWGSTPVLAMDGPTPDGIQIAARNAYSSADDEWASAEYRQEMAEILSLRCLKRLNLE